MKKIIFLCMLIFLFQNSLAEEILEDVGIAKYAVLEVKEDNTPLREETNENSKRLTHLYKDTVLFADKKTGDYYRVELGDEDYYWINNKFVEVQAIIPEKRFNDITKIKYDETKDKYKFIIKTNSFGPYKIKEEKNKLQTVFYDVHFDPNTVKAFDNPYFKVSDLIDTKFQIDYFSQDNLFGYKVEKDDDSYIFEVKKTPKINPKKPLKHIKVTLDAGHGGNELGACCFGLKEKDLNLKITKYLKRGMKRNGAKVFLTRKKDKRVELYDRVKFAQEKNSDILISIHQNSLPNRNDVDKKHGVGTYYYNEEAKPLAKKIQDNLLVATNFKDDNVNYASFVLTRPTMPISVLVECGYIIHPQEAQKLSQKKFQKEIAKAIRKGCEEYLLENFSNKKL